MENHHVSMGKSHEKPEIIRCHLPRKKQQQAFVHQFVHAKSPTQKNTKMIPEVTKDHKLHMACLSFHLTTMGHSKRSQDHQPPRVFSSHLCCDVLWCSLYAFLWLYINSEMVFLLQSTFFRAFFLACNQKDSRKICLNLWNFGTDSLQRKKKIQSIFRCKGPLSPSQWPALWPLRSGGPPIFPYLSRGVQCLTLSFRRKKTRLIASCGSAGYLPAEMIFHPRGLLGFSKISSFLPRFRWLKLPPSLEYPSDMVQLSFLFVDGRFRDYE